MATSSSRPLPEPWRDRKVNPYADKTELVPISFLLRMAGGNSCAEDHVLKLMASIRKEGFREAIPLSYSVERRLIRRDEGNHRVEAARRLGIAAVPVRFCRSSRFYDWIDTSFLLRVPGIEPDEHGYVPADLRPSQIGVPTVRS